MSIETWSARNYRERMIKGWTHGGRLWLCWLDMAVHIEVDSEVWTEEGPRKWQGRTGECKWTEPPDGMKIHTQDQGRRTEKEGKKNVFWRHRYIIQHIWTWMVQTLHLLQATPGYYRCWVTSICVFNLFFLKKKEGVWHYFSKLLYKSGLRFCYWLELIHQTHPFQTLLYWLL